MAQRLIFPFKSAMIICGYKTARYKSAWGYPHYGIDISSIQGGQTGTDHLIYASGNGKVVWCKKDVATNCGKSLGYAIAIEYDDCIAHDGTVKSLIVRYMHSALVNVKVGDTVTTSSVVAVEGMEGTQDYHCHFEIDTDTKYPQYSPQVASGHSGWKKGTDSTLNPSLWLWQNADRKTIPYAFTDKSWINLGVDDSIPFVPAEESYTALIESLRAENKALKEQIAEQAEIIEQFRALAKKAAAL